MESHGVAATYVRQRAHDAHGKPTQSGEAPISPAILMTEKEAAQVVGFSVRTLQAWRVRGAGPRFVKVSARCVRYRQRDLEEWVEERLRSSTSDRGQEP